MRSTTALAIVRILAYAIIFCLTAFMFYHQATGEYWADTLVYVQSASNSDAAFGSYSFVTLIFKPAYAIAGCYGVAATLAATVVATIAMTELTLRRMTPGAKDWVVLAFAIMCNFTCAIYLPFAHKNVYLGIVAGNVWHSPTYLLMKLFSLCAIYCYLNLSGRFGSQKMPLNWVLFTVFCVLSTGFKPSFIVVFGPTVLALRIIALVRDRNTWKTSVAIGVSLALTLGILAVQYTILFPSGESGGIAFGYGVIWHHYHGSILAATVQSFAFPLLVLLSCAKLLKDDENYLLAWMMFVLAYFEYVFLYETGDRMYDGNMGWSLSFATFYLMASSVSALFNKWGQAMPCLINSLNLKTTAKDSPTWSNTVKSGSNAIKLDATSPATTEAIDAVAGSLSAEKGQSKRVASAYCIIALAFFAWHEVSGIYFFWLMATGIGFF